jgi:hypothetical protein
MHWLIILVIVALSGCGMLNRASSENLATASETELVCTKEKVIGSILRETRCVSAAQLEAEGRQARAVLKQARGQNGALGVR